MMHPMPKVLIIEDDDRIRPLLVRGLRDCGHTVTSAPTGMGGLQLAVDSSPDLVVLDLDLGGEILYEAQVERILVEDDRAVGVRLETDRVDAAVDLGDTQDLLDLLGGRALRDVHGLAAEAAGLGQPVLVEITHKHDGGAEQLRTRCGGCPVCAC